jgi:hypothetical protein
MKKLLLTVALVGLVGTAHAEPLKPEATASKPTLGTWCRAGTSEIELPKETTAAYYRREANPPRGRAPCKGDEWVEIREDGYDGPEFSCKAVNGKDSKIYAELPDLRIITYRCAGEGYAWKEECNVGISYITALKGRALLLICEDKGRLKK